MMDWCKGLPEATEFSLFPPAGQVSAYERSKERVQAWLRDRFPELEFQIANISLGKHAAIIPILGEAGEGGRGLYAAPPSPHRLQEIEIGLRDLDLGRAALS